MTAPLPDIRVLPLFAGIPDAHLTALFQELTSSTFAEGHVLFRAGEVPANLLVLVRGEVTIEEAGHPKFRLRPVAPIGELGALTGLPRNGSAIAATEIEVLSIAVPSLLAFFGRRADIAFPFYKNILGLVSAKVRRDEHRLEEMRTNLIRTQKAMKTLREVVLSSPETAISKPVCDALDDLIEHNRRSHYRVTPVASAPSSVRLDDGALVRVIDLSDGYVKLDATCDRITKDRSHWAGVLVLPLGEILVSGRIERDGPDGVVVKLDPMIDSYKKQLEDYVTHLQLLNYVI